MSPHHSCLHCSVGCHITARCSCGCHIKTEDKQTATFRVYFFHPWDKSFQFFIEAGGYDAVQRVEFYKGRKERYDQGRERERGREISGGED